MEDELFNRKLSAQQRWYYKNREKEIERMRSKTKERAELRKQYIEEHPEEIEFFREEWRKQYRNKITNSIKKQIEKWIINPLLTKAQRSTLETVLIEKTFTTMTKRDLKSLEKMINLPTNKVNGESIKKDERSSLRSEENEEEAPDEGEASVYCSSSDSQD